MTRHKHGQQVPIQASGATRTMAMPTKAGDGSALILDSFHPTPLPCLVPGRCRKNGQATSLTQLSSMAEA
jgi:hypothetical protein